MRIDPFTQNQLADASSPYLRQHAGNPVHWQRWTDKTLAHAKTTGTPILLSIGYSACHWCHVMAHGCFENSAIAAAMNTAFINIKLDREERPDIDQIYQLAYQGLNGRGGGWPLTAFLDPQTLAPFYIGTYFPPTSSHGLPGFPEVLTGVRTYFDTHRDELRGQADQLRDWLTRVQGGHSGTRPALDTAESTALERIRSHSDPDWGGTQGAPKFPRASNLEWLLDHRSKTTNAREMAWRTLEMMATRGLQDHLGGGFFRYCVDERWTIPHFEKMLYDNAQLLPAYARMASDPDVSPQQRAVALEAVHGIVEWLAREMTTPKSTFFSSFDADSEGQEGKFYLWTHEQFREALPVDHVEPAERVFGLDQLPNFEGRAWHLLRTQALAGTASNEEYRAIRHGLFEAREKRTPPGRDDKVLTAWNALTISGLARSARMLDDESCAGMAFGALTGLSESVWIDHELYANAALADARIPGFLDDYAFLLDALLEVLQLRFDVQRLDWAIQLANALVDRFSDAKTGGFWFSSMQHATPLARSFGWQDDALPSGNAVAIRSLLRLGHLIGDARFVAAAERALDAAAGALSSYPEAAAALLQALRESDQPRLQIVIRCSNAQDGQWRNATRTYLHDRALIPGGDPTDVFIVPVSATGLRLPGALAAREPRGDSGTAYVCQGMSCRAPVNHPEELATAGAAGSSE